MRLLPPPNGRCMCGCGEPANEHFVSGHDAKLASAMKDQLIAAIRQGDVETAFGHFNALQCLDYWFFGSSVWSPGRKWLEGHGYRLDTGYKLVRTRVEKAAREFMRDYLGLTDRQALD